MIKSELIQKIADKFPQIPEKVVAQCVGTIIDNMSTTLASGERIEIRGFGSFSLHYRPPRNAHNPKTGERVLTAPKYSPHFKPGKGLRERINNARHMYPIQSDDRVEDDD